MRTPFWKTAILLSPSNVYADIVLRRLRDVSFEGSPHAELESVAETLCLAVPVAGARPQEVREILTDLKKRDVRDVVTQLVDESLQAME